MACDTKERIIEEALRLFSEKGYAVERVTPVDMFPRTPHVECVVLMSRK